MRHLRTWPLLLLLAALSIALSAQTRSDLAQRIDTLISQGPTAHGLWGIEITDLESGEVLYEYDSARLFMPASNQKLITTAAALALIGPQWTFHTTVESTAPIGHNGRLAGDLVLVGRGDPNISGRALPYHPNGQRIATEVILQGLADQLVAHGLKLVQGDVVGDDSYLVWQPFSTGWAWDDLMWDSGAPVSALSVNDNLISVTLKPGPKAGDPVEIVLAPDLAYYKIDNRAVTAAAHSGPRRVGMHRDPGSRTLIIWGTVPLGDAGATLNLTIQDPAEYAARLLRELLKERGVQVLGGVKVRHTEMMTLPLPKPGEKPQPTPPKPMAEPAAPAPGTHVLAEHISRPLVDDLKVTDKVSQNLHAELLLRLLGRLRGETASLAGGINVERWWLEQAGVPPEEFAIHDGSGLSRLDLVSPHAMVTLLRYAQTQPWGAQFWDLLPAGGVDGTLQDRFKSPAMAGRVQAKTGSFEHVNALSGYLTTTSGRRLAFSIFCNNHMAGHRQAVEVIDAIVGAVVDDGAPAK